jgi:hypothetical protein
MPNYLLPQGIDVTKYGVDGKGIFGGRTIN